MKKILTVFLVSLLLMGPVSAYQIGGAFASLVTCEYGQMGYQYGFIGTYNLNGQYYTVFFGHNYCET